MGIETWAREIARTRLEVALPRRWAHVQGVAVRAAEVAALFGHDADLLVAAALLHDVGYAPDVVQTGFHPLDGAQYLEGLNANSRLCALIARHSNAIQEAKLRGLESTLEGYPDERTALRDALWWADMTTAPDGRPTTIDDRLSEVRRRYGADHLVSKAIEASTPELQGAAERTCRRVKQGIPPG
ncbi:HD domain-containing protein [Actinocrispum wychmicini]|uniref:HD domain-containing protein n=1 Tax=Actinocrispum wychmicini TaxID=1213861 RepID=UPI00105079FB|nr:HD domain-containing protein [Actinocrispum wychmicini]